jgi:transposase InsO family protein
MDQRDEFVRLALVPGANKSELCRRFGVSRSNGYKWLRRYLAEGPEGLVERSRRPRRSPAQTPARTEKRVVALRDRHPAWGGRKLHRRLQDQGVAEVPSASTITEILRRNGRLEAGTAERSGAVQRFERAQPNELWQIDFKGHFATARGRCHPLGVLDDHSRYGLGLEACGDERAQTVHARLEAIFRRYGLPEEMLMDNGAPWGDAGDQPWTALTVWLLRLGIGVIHGRPYHPQTQGKEERFHRTVKVEVVQGRYFRDLGECQRAFDAWRPVYNYERPHQALALATPASRYRPSRRSLPDRLAPIEYGEADLVRRVDNDGLISFRNRPWRVGKPFRGQPVALRPTLADGVFSIHFCAHQLGTIDLRAGAESACGFVDNAAALPTTPQAQPQQKR